MSFSGIWRSIKRFFRTTPRPYLIGGGIVIVVIILTVNILSRTSQSSTTVDTTPHVTLASVSSLSSDSATLPLTGTVSSLHQANILSQSAGEIRQVYRKLGDRVAAGQIIAQFDSSSQSAAVVQAQGVYDAAIANLEKTKNGSDTNQKDITAINQETAQQTVVSDHTAAVTAAQSAYAALDDAIHAKTDPIFNNPRSPSPTLLFQTTNSQLTIDLQNERPMVEQKLQDLNALANSLSGSSDIDAVAPQAASDIQYIADFLSDASAAANSGIATQQIPQSALAGYQTSINAARSAVSSALAGLNSAKTAYDNAVSGAAVAGKQLTDANQGGRPEDIAAAQASVKQALGALDGARANLEKTVIRSPISGTIVTLPIKTGDYIGSFAQAAIVSNPGALEIVTNVTSDDAKSLAVGDKAEIGDSKIAGVITSIAPALDPTTNKIQVHVGITGDASTLTDGETVSLNLIRQNSNPSNTSPSWQNATTGTAGQAASSTPDQITIPIASLKISPVGPVVFTLSTSSTLVSHAVTIGSILGDRVIIRGGLTPDMTIIADARGHSEGEKVIVDQ